MRSLFCSIIVVSVLLVGCGKNITAQQYIENGLAYVEKQDLKSAIIEFKNALKAEPDNSTARAELGKAYVEIYSTNAAIKELNKAKELGYDQDKILISLAKAYEQGNEYQKILDEIKISQSQPPLLKANIYAIRAKAYLHIGDKENAHGSLVNALGLDKNLTEVRLAWAEYEKLNNNVKAVREWVDPLLQANGGNADAWSLLGEIEQGEENYEAAETAYSKSISLRTYGHIDSIRRALVRIALKDYVGAQSDVDKLKKIGANWPIVGHTEGVIAFQTSKIDSARNIFQSVLSKFPDYPPTQYMLALISYNQGNYQNALTMLERYTAQAAYDVKAIFLLSNTLLKLNQPEKALVALNKIEPESSQDFRYLSMKANAYLLLNETDQAIKLLKKAIFLNPDNTALRLQLGSVLLKSNETFTQGQNEIKTALEMNPDLTEGKLLLFRSYLKKKDFLSALNVAKGLEKANPESSQGSNLVALTYLAEGQIVGAQEYLKKTLERFPADLTTSNNLARIYLQQQDYKNAESIYKKVITKYDDNIQALNQLALISAKQGDKEQMIAYLVQAQQKNPDNLSSKLLLASQYLRLSETNKAAEVLNKVQNSDKDSPGYILLMSQVKIRLGENQHALRLLKSLNAQHPEITSTNMLLAQVYAAENKPIQMREALETLLKVSPGELTPSLILARLDLKEGKIVDFGNRVEYLQKTYPENDDVKFLVAIKNSNNKNYDSAVNALSDLMTTSPNSQVVTELSVNQWKAGNKESAISSLELWLSEHSSDSKSLSLLAQFYLAEDRMQEAKDSYQKLEKLAPDNPAILNNLAWFMIESNPSEGKKYAERALDLSPGNPYIGDTLAMINLKLGNLEEALKLSENAASNAPEEFDIQLNYARILIRTKDNKRARQVLMKLSNVATDEHSKELITKELAKL